MSDYLMKGDYAKLLEEASTEYPVALSLTKVFHSLLVSRCYYLVKIAPGRTGTFLEAYLERFLAEDMKRILRAKHAQRIVDKGSLIPVTKAYDYVNLQALADAATLQDAVDLLKKTRYHTVTDGMPFYEKYHLASVLEALIDRTYYHSQVLPRLAKLPGRSDVREMLGTEVDLTNIKTIMDLRARKVAVDAVRSLCLVPMSLTSDELELISGNTPDSIPQVVSETRYDDLAQPLQDALQQAKDESLDHLVRRQVYARTRSMMFPCAYSFAYVLGYVREAEAECNNLISIATGKDLGLAEGRIQTALCM